jgi:hypothetical protein
MIRLMHALLDARRRRDEAEMRRRAAWADSARDAPTVAELTVAGLLLAEEPPQPVESAT